MTEYKIGDLLRHKTGDIGIVVGFTKNWPGAQCRVIVHWMDFEHGLEPDALPESAEALRKNTDKLVAG